MLDLTIVSPDIELPEKLVEFNLPDDIDNTNENEFYCNAISRTVSWRLAFRQVLGILRTMSDFSLTQFVNAINRGQVEGDIYGITMYSFDGKAYQAESYRESNLNDFTGCLLGWAGFLENAAIMQVRQHYAGIVGIESKEAYNVITKAAEGFIAYIHEGDIPESSPFSKKLLELVQYEIERRKAVA